VPQCAGNWKKNGRKKIDFIGCVFINLLGAVAVSHNNTTAHITVLWVLDQI